MTKKGSILYRAFFIYQRGDTVPNRNFEIHMLKQSFFNKYPHYDYEEILEKEYRPYFIFKDLINDCTFAVPFRTQIKHNNLFEVKSSTRKSDGKVGLDFSKAVVVQNEDIGRFAGIENHEYREIEHSFAHIFLKFNRYLNAYKAFALSEEKDPRAINKFRYSSLPYFHNELGIQQRLNNHVAADDDLLDLTAEKSVGAAR